jgi:hypothetical protein
MKMMIQTLAATALLMASVTSLAAQQTHYACRTRAGTVIMLQEDAAGSIALTRTENEQVPELGMIAMTQKQVLVANPGDSQTLLMDNGDTKQITLNFHGKPSDSQVVLTLTKPFLGSVDQITITGTGAALARVKNLMSGSEGLSLSGCRINIP